MQCSGVSTRGLLHGHVAPPPPTHTHTATRPPPSGACMPLSSSASVAGGPTRVVETVLCRWRRRRRRRRCRSVAWHQQSPQSSACWPHAWRLMTVAPASTACASCLLLNRYLPPPSLTPRVYALCQLWLNHGYCIGETSESGETSRVCLRLGRISCRFCPRYMVKVQQTATDRPGLRHVLGSIPWKPRMLQTCPSDAASRLLASSCYDIIATPWSCVCKQSMKINKISIFSNLPEGTKAGERGHARRVWCANTAAVQQHAGCPGWIVPTASVGIAQLGKLDMRTS